MPATENPTPSSNDAIAKPPSQMTVPDSSSASMPMKCMMAMPLPRITPPDTTLTLSPLDATMRPATDAIAAQPSEAIVIQKS